MIVPVKSLRPLNFFTHHSRNLVPQNFILTMGFRESLYLWNSQTTINFINLTKQDCGWTSISSNICIFNTIYTTPNQGYNFSSWYGETLYFPTTSKQSHLYLDMVIDYSRIICERKSWKSVALVITTCNLF